MRFRIVMYTMSIVVKGLPGLCPAGYIYPEPYFVRTKILSEFFFQPSFDVILPYE